MMVHENMMKLMRMFPCETTRLSIEVNTNEIVLKYCTYYIFRVMVLMSVTNYMNSRAGVRPMPIVGTFYRTKHVSKAH